MYTTSQDDAQKSRSQDTRLGWGMVLDHGGIEHREVIAQHRGLFTRANATTRAQEGATNNVM